ncbi:MAG TPA: chromosome partitioning protein ParB [Rhodospirillaceae bacterium]|nr:chromosome partitioning protein ParB [Rhodospirillaceae bacterium]
MNAKASNKPMPLGRGLSALFGDADASYQPRPVAAAPVPQAQDGNTVHMLPIEWIQPGAFQPRRHFDDLTIQELADSIKEKGILQPLTVRTLEEQKNSFEIIAGERRWRAAQLAGLHEVPALVRVFTDREAMEIGLIENVQRQDLSPIEEAEGYKRLVTEFNYEKEDLVKVVGKSFSHIGNLIRILTLPETVKKMVNDGALSMGHARAVITAKDPEALANEIVKKGLSVRQAEALAKKMLQGKITSASRKESRADPDILALEKSLEQTLGLKTKLQTKGSKGSLTFYYTDLDQLDELIKRFQD